jgi:hypothetical protein
MSRSPFVAEHVAKMGVAAGLGKARGSKLMKA